MDDSSPQEVCPICGKHNSPGCTFCGYCGTRLDVSGDSFRSQIRSILKSELQDQTVVEIQTAQNVVARVSEWAKLFAFFAGIAIVVFLGALAVLGIRGLSDLNDKIRSAEQGALSAEKRIEILATQAQDIEKTGTQLKATYAQLSADAAKYQALDKQVAALQSRVSAIENRKYEPSTSLTPELKGELDANLKRFQEYVATLGYAPQQASIRIEISPKTSPLQYRPTFDGAHHVVILSVPDAADPFIPLRTYMHSVLFARGVPTVDPDGHWQSNAVEAGLADYFAASFLKSARPSKIQPALDLTTAQVWNTEPAELTEAVHERDILWASICWQLREKLGAERFDAVLFRSWQDLEATDYPLEFVKPFARHLAQRLGPDGNTAREVFAARGISF